MSMPAGELAIYMVSPTVGGLKESLAALRPSGAEALILAGALLLYLGGLFAPVWDRNRLSR